MADAGVVRFGMPLDDRPEMKDLGKVMTDYCLQWKDIGPHLGLTSSVLNVIEADNPTSKRECFRSTLDKWLKLDLNATWQKLEIAITKANQDSMGKLPATQKPSGATKEQFSAAENPKLNSEPEVIDLLEIVVPRIYAHWRDVAFALYYKIAIVNGIEAKHNKDPEDSCKELLEDWLSTDNGARAGPQTWSTLLNAIGKVKKLKKSKDEILQELAKL